MFSCAIGLGEPMKFVRLIALVAALALLAAACGGDTATAPIELDEPGAADDAAEAARAEEIEAEQEEAMEDEAVEEEAMEDEEAVASDMRIVSLSPTATEMLFAVGSGELLVQADTNSNYPAEAAALATIETFPLNVEAVAGFEPTLVLSSAPVEGLDALGIENMVLPAAVTFDDIYTQIEQIGATTGQVGNAAEVVANMQADVEEILSSVPEREVPLTYYHELDPTLFSVTSATFIGQVYSMLGLENAADAADPDGEAFGFPQLSEEYLVNADPDIIFLADTRCCEQNAETVSARPGWDQLSAVQNGNIVELDDDTASRWSPRLVEFMRTVVDAVAELETVGAN